ncbi:MAG: phosphate acyltransferase [Phycisphaerae bacterium]|nr:phosphate acyltransferase [Phycisphaerae bacterium]MBM91805.1 phosphate acyltransferase [Phycisphaerae bacterium]
MSIRIAIDVMGGDHAPAAILDGCISALTHLGPDDTLVLIGPEDVIAGTLSDKGIEDQRIEIEHASESIPMGASPTVAVRQMQDSSIVKMAKLGSKKAEVLCDAVISAGNTGACVAAGQMHMKRLSGVHRPGIAVTFPSFHGPVVLCDAGANPEPRATHLWQYGIMAEIYAKRVLNIDSPRVGLMNIGSEEGKGSLLAKETAELLRRTPDINYIGFIEGRDIFSGTADVIVTDGFVGNTVLKMAEGFAKSIFQAIAQEIFEHDPKMAMQFEPIVKQIYKKNDYHEYGGAPLLGVNGVMMIAHGTSEARTINAAIRNTLEYVRGHVNDEIVARLSQLETIEQGEPAS